MDIQAVPRDFPALEQYTWFQNGGVSITPVPVTVEYTRWKEEMVRRIEWAAGGEIVISADEHGKNVKSDR